MYFRCCSCHIDNNSTLLSRCITSYNTRRCAVGTRTYKRSPVSPHGILRDAISTPGRHPAGLTATPGLNGTICMGCGHRGTCLFGNGVYTFPRDGSGILEFVRDAFVRARGFTFFTGPREYPESRTKTAGFLDDFDCCVVHPTPSRASQ